jgi:hypothetical protein
MKFSRPPFLRRTAGSTPPVPVPATAEPPSVPEELPEPPQTAENDPVQPLSPEAQQMVDAIERVMAPPARRPSAPDDAFDEVDLDEDAPQADAVTLPADEEAPTGEADESAPGDDNPVDADR